MKAVYELCSYCKEMSWIDKGKKQATTRSGAHTRRTTIRCRKCGTKEIINTKKGRRIIVGKNKLPNPK